MGYLVLNLEISEFFVKLSLLESYLPRPASAGKLILAVQFFTVKDFFPAITPLGS
jgi:hypothetical protein